jgi:hypothetical protein
LPRSLHITLADAACAGLEAQARVRGTSPEALAAAILNREFGQVADLDGRADDSNLGLDFDVLRKVPRPPSY